MPPRSSEDNVGKAGEKDVDEGEGADEDEDGLEAFSSLRKLPHLRALRALAQNDEDLRRVDVYNTQVK